MEKRNMTIGLRLREYLMERNLTQEEFSRLSGVSKQTINNVIKDKTAPSGEVLVKIAAEYNDLNLNWLVSGRGIMFEHGKSQNKNQEGLKNEVIEENYKELLELKNNIIVSQKETINALKETILSQKELIENIKKRS